MHPYNHRWIKIIVLTCGCKPPLEIRANYDSCVSIGKKSTIFGLEISCIATVVIHRN